MSSETPDQAGERRQAEPSSREMGRPPWDVALLANVRALEGRLAEAEAERSELLLANHQLSTKLRVCRERLENWKLRQQAWGRERDELLAQLKPPGGKPR